LPGDRCVTKSASVRKPVRDPQPVQHDRAHPGSARPRRIDPRPQHTQTESRQLAEKRIAEDEAAALVSKPRPALRDFVKRCCSAITAEPDLADQRL